MIRKLLRRFKKKEPLHFSEYTIVSGIDFIKKMNAEHWKKVRKERKDEMD